MKNCLLHFWGFWTGTYAYIETSAPRALNDKAQLRSETFRNNRGNKCLQFWYNMMGRNVGTLNVYIVQNNIKTLKWTISGQQANQWNQGRLPVPITRKSFSVSI